LNYYTLFENEDNVLVNQVIWDIEVLESYEATETTVLYYYIENGNRYYSLESLENLRGQNVYIVDADLSNIFRYSMGKTRRKYLYNLIRESLF